MKYFLELLCKYKLENLLNKCIKKFFQRNNFITQFTLPVSQLPESTLHSSSFAPAVQSTLPMITCSKCSIFKPKALLASALLLALEPTSYTTARKCPEWQFDIFQKFEALHRQHTWSLIPLAPGKNVVDCKSVYRIKRHQNGTIARYKARPVAKGFHQLYRVDYDETFGPIVKKPIVRLVLALSIKLGWPLRQLDVKNAFLYGHLSEEVFVTTLWFS